MASIEQNRKLMVENMKKVRTQLNESPEKISGKVLDAFDKVFDIERKYTTLSNKEILTDITKKLKGKTIAWRDYINGNAGTVQGKVTAVKDFKNDRGDYIVTVVVDGKEWTISDMDKVYIQ